ncbi:LacI family DNA-binding transcriptional regulator [Actinotalea ferrariae]|nr:LacI family DNA-binding transcriptional regulator [Actinotalea ferrariae]
MRDVARVAGVSVKTVSNVVNDFPYVSEATRRRVRAAIDQLGYQMNFSARNLSLGRTGMVTLAVPELSLPYFAELSDEIIDAAAARGYTVLIEQTGGLRQREMEVLFSARRRMTDGLIFSPLALRGGDASALEVDFPIVLLGERALHSQVPHVAMANVDGARAVTEHLLAQGRRRIAVVGGFDESGTGAGSLRTAGVRAALAEAGLALDDALVGHAATWTRGTGADAMRSLLERGRPFDAVVGLNDVLALGAMRVLYERGVGVPDDVAVVGFDDIEEARFSRPSLTTVDPGRTQIARTAVELLLERLDGGTSRAVEVVADHRLVPRESTGA